MADNTIASVHINQALTNMSLGYHPMGMIAEQVIGVINVQNETDFYYVWNKGDALRRVDPRRTDGVRANRVDYGYTRDTYSCEEYALEMQITDRVRRNADSALRLELNKTRRVQDTLALEQERRVADLFTTSANYASTNYTTLSGVTQWNNAAFSGSIEQVIDDAKEAVRQGTANNIGTQVAIIPMAVTKVVKRDAKVRDILKYTHADLLVNGELPPKLWNLDIVVPAVTEVTGREIFGSDISTGADVWGKHVTITQRPSSPSIDSLAHAYIFRNRDTQVEQWRDEPTSSYWYRIGNIQTEKIVCNTAGYLIINCIA